MGLEQFNLDQYKKIKAPCTALSVCTGCIFFLNISGHVPDVENCKIIKSDRRHTFQSIGCTRETKYASVFYIFTQSLKGILKKL